MVSGDFVGGAWAVPTPPGAEARASHETRKRAATQTLINLSSASPPDPPAGTRCRAEPENLLAVKLGK
jgi:hypothetical protein